MPASLLHRLGEGSDSVFHLSVMTPDPGARTYAGYLEYTKLDAKLDN